MAPSSRLLVIDAVVPVTIGAGDAQLEKILMSDLNMLLVTGGHERSAIEWESLLSSAGLKMLRVLPIRDTTASIIEASPSS